ncbi:hypothetical protein Scep_010030 [Stephania cephalantha]|uniref:Uncharacterized protein n=1 Tax=Stephania cephalantha TaxID=152367 RepID=A0AAP0PEU8_9MAGN
MWRAGDGLKTRTSFANFWETSTTTSRGITEIYMNKGAVVALDDDDLQTYSLLTRGDWVRQLTVEELDELRGDTFWAGDGLKTSTSCAKFWETSTTASQGITDGCWNEGAAIELDADDMWTYLLLMSGCAWRAGRINDSNVAAN